MKKALLTVALVMAASASSAQDWTGPYGGLTLGRGAGDFAVTGSTASGTYDSGSIGGLFVGFNLERNGMVYGAELAYQNADLPNRGFPGQGVDRLIDVKSRVGFAAGPSMVYGVLGYSSNRVFVPGATSEGSGISFGIGYDYQISDMFILGGEFMSRQMENDATSSIIGVEPDIGSFALRAGIKF